MRADQRYHRRPVADHRRHAPQCTGIQGQRGAGITCRQRYRDIGRSRIKVRDAEEISITRVEREVDAALNDLRSRRESVYRCIIHRRHIQRNSSVAGSGARGVFYMRRDSRVYVIIRCRNEFHCGERSIDLSNTSSHGPDARRR